MSQSSQNKALDLDKIIDDLMSINNFLPNEDDDEPFSLEPDLSTAEAINEMRKQGLNEVPVLSSNDEILGVFSFRKFAEMVAENDYGDTPIGKLPVDEFLESPDQFYVPVEANISSTIDRLLQSGYLIVGNPKRYLGLLTLSDTTKGLYRIAQAFILIQHIELLLRAIIRRCVPESDLTQILKSKNKHIKTSDLDETTFGNLKYIVNDNWHYFEKVFGNQERTLVKLEKVRQSRNAVFHFNNYESIDHSELQGHRDWLVRRAKQYNASTGGSFDE